MLRVVEICCERKFKHKILDFVTRSYFPIDSCLKICEKKGILDACAVLYKRKGQYKKSIELYLKVLTDLSHKKMLFILLAKPNVAFNDPSVKSQHIKKFDQFIMSMVKICDKYGSRLSEQEAQNLWLYTI